MLYWFYLIALEGLRGKIQFNWVLKRGVLGNPKPLQQWKSAISGGLPLGRRGWCLLHLAKGREMGSWLNQVFFAITLLQKVLHSNVVVQSPVISGSLNLRYLLECAVLDSQPEYWVGATAFSAEVFPRAQSQGLSRWQGILCQLSHRPSPLACRDWWYHEWWLISNVAPISYPATHWRLCKAP